MREEGLCETEGNPGFVTRSLQKKNSDRALSIRGIFFLEQNGYEFGYALWNFERRLHHRLNPRQESLLQRKWN
jgi:hypothetical protein